MPSKMLKTNASLIVEQVGGRCVHMDMYSRSTKQGYNIVAQIGLSVSARDSSAPKRCEEQCSDVASQLLGARVAI